MAFYDDLETRSADERADDLRRDLPGAIARAKTAPALARILQGIDPEAITTREALAGLPVIRKSELSEAQKKAPPFGGFATRRPHEFEHIFQSPGPIYEPGMRGADWWRLGRFLGLRRTAPQHHGCRHEPHPSLHRRILRPEWLAYRPGPDRRRAAGASPTQENAGPCQVFLSHGGRDARGSGHADIAARGMKADVRGAQGFIEGLVAMK